MTNGSLMKVKSIAECSKKSILQILLTCIEQYSVLKINFWSSFEWPFKTGFTVLEIFLCLMIAFILMNSADPDEMPQAVTSHLCLYCLLMLKLLCLFFFFSSFFVCLL